MPDYLLKNEQTRVDYIDILRAIGIISMIMGHIQFGNIFNKWIHIFHMPMFFIISGFFYKEKNFSTMIKRRIRTLIIPYFVFGLLHCLISFIVNGHFDSHVFYILFWENTAEGGVPIAGALWFLTAIFITEILFWFLQHLRIATIWTTIIAALVTIAGMACATYLPFRLPWAIDAGMVGVGLYQLGKLTKDKMTRILELKFVYSLIGIAFFSILGLLTPYINIREGNFGIWPTFLINSVGMTFSFWIFFRCFYGWIKDKKVMQRFVAWIKGIGRESIVYLCLNQLSILLAGEFITFVIPAESLFFIIVRKLLILIITMVELYIFQKLFCNTKLKVVIGK